MTLLTKVQKASCSQCGICCTKGGPALHVADLEPLRNGAWPLEDLFTIRKGELVQKPFSDEASPTKTELVKLKGKRGSWTCTYFDETLKNCSIYLTRPYSCTVLECWNPTASIELIERDTLTRMDIIEEQDPLRGYVLEYEALCPVPDYMAVKERRLDDDGKAQISLLANTDLRIRTGISSKFNLSVDNEMFYFGRPVFQLLAPLGVQSVQNLQGITLKWL